MIISGFASRHQQNPPLQSWDDIVACAVVEVAAKQHKNILPQIPRGRVASPRSTAWHTPRGTRQAGEHSADRAHRVPVEPAPEPFIKPPTPRRRERFRIQVPPKPSELQPRRARAVLKPAAPSAATPSQTPPAAPVSSSSSHRGKVKVSAGHLDGIEATHLEVAAQHLEVQIDSPHRRPSNQSLLERAGSGRELSHASGLISHGNREREDLELLDDIFHYAQPPDDVAEPFIVSPREASRLVDVIPPWQPVPMAATQVQKAAKRFDKAHEDFTDSAEYALGKLHTSAGTSLAAQRRLESALLNIRGNRFRVQPLRAFAQQNALLT